MIVKQWRFDEASVHKPVSTQLSCWLWYLMSGSLFFPRFLKNTHSDIFLWGLRKKRLFFLHEAVCETVRFHFVLFLSTCSHRYAASIASSDNCGVTQTVHVLMIYWSLLLRQTAHFQKLQTCGLFSRNTQLCLTVQIIQYSLYRQ